MAEYNAKRITSDRGVLKPEATRLNPGDEAVPGTPGTGENICPRCRGRGRLEGNLPCPDCGGSGKIIEGIGGG